MAWRFFKFTRLVFNLFALIFVVQSFPTSEYAPYQSWSNNYNDFNKKDTDHSWPDNFNFGSSEDDQHQILTRMATKIIAGIIIFLVIASFIAFLICLCCPICILAKMRNRRRGIIYHPAGSGNTTTVQTGRTTVTVLQSAPRSTATPPAMVVATNIAPNNSPYPVQPSVTVVPVPTSNGQPNYSHKPYPYPNQTAAPYPTASNSMPVPMTYPSAPGELPPPYPGLPREMDSVQASAQPAYNPYFDGNGDPSSPYMSTTAPYPTKH